MSVNVLDNIYMSCDGSGPPSEVRYRATQVLGPAIRLMECVLVFDSDLHSARQGAT